jgi:glycine cleavage system H protein
MSTLKYTKAHEWLRLEDDGTLTMGISNFAQEQLGDVVYVELPPVGKTVKAGDNVVIVESVKNAGEIKAPVGGTVTAVNDRLVKEPEVINADALGDGWLVKMKVENTGELNAFMDADGYRSYLDSLA